MVYFLIFLTPLLNFFLSEAFAFRAGLFFISLALTNIFYLVAVRVITGKKINTRDFWNFSIFPILFSSSLSIYSLLIVNHVIVHFLFVINFIFGYFYLKNIYRGEQKDFLENISSYGNLLTVFFLFSMIFGLESFLGWPIWILILCSSAAIILVIYQILWANKAKAENILAYVFLAGLILAQLCWAIYFLPFNFNTLGLLATICYYILIGFIKLSLANKLTARSIKLYLASGFIFLILILLTTKWA
jgi:hypothetical protein